MSLFAVVFVGGFAARAAGKSHATLMVVMVGTLALFDGGEAVFMVVGEKLKDDAINIDATTSSAPHATAPVPAP